MQSLQLLYLSIFVITCLSSRSCYAVKTDVKQESEHYNERTKTMNNQTGQLIGKDKLNNSVIVEWQKTNITSPIFAGVMAEVWDFAREAYLPVEMNFLKAFPDVVGKEPYFKAFEPLFKDGVENVDWAAAERVMADLLKNHFVFDPSKFSEQVVKMFADDICFFVTLKEASSRKTIGFITILMRKSYAQGDAKIMSFAVDPAHQNRGLGKLLMSAIFKIMPDVQRIFLCTRVTNEAALKAYRSWGFITDPQPIMDHPFNLEHWTFLHYPVRNSIILQSAAARLV